jgi:hypothetical protein
MKNRRRRLWLCLRRSRATAQKEREEGLHRLL